MENLYRNSKNIFVDKSLYFFYEGEKFNSFIFTTFYFYISKSEEVLKKRNWREQLLPTKQKKSSKKFFWESSLVLLIIKKNYLITLCHSFGIKFAPLKLDEKNNYFCSCRPNFINYYILSFQFDYEFWRRNSSKGCNC